MKGEYDSGYPYNADYPYLREVVERTGNLRYNMRTILKDYGLIYWRLGLRPGHKVLDVGSCIGSLGHFLKYGGITTYGTDLNFSAIKEGRRTFGVESRNQSVVACAINLPFPSGFFDAVVTEDVFEHFPSQEFAEGVFTEMQRVLSPDRKRMYHKITVAEDIRHIDADESHMLKLTTDQWREFFGRQGWDVIADPNLRAPIIGKTYPGYFLIQK